MPAKLWEFRINGIRQSGDTFTSWEAAMRRMFTELNRMHHAFPEDRDHNGRKECELIAEHARLRKQSPRVGVFVNGHRDGKYWGLEVNRIPW